MTLTQLNEKVAGNRWDNQNFTTNTANNAITRENKVFFVNPKWIGVGGANKEGKIPTVKNRTDVEKDVLKNIPTTIEFQWKPKQEDGNTTNSNPISLDSSIEEELEKLVSSWGFVIDGYKFNTGFPQQNKPLLISISNDAADISRGSSKWRKLG